MDLGIGRTAIRRPLSLFAALFAVFLGLFVPARQAAAVECATPAVERFGPASLTGAIVGATVHDGRGYLVTRGLKPAVLAEYDLATRTVVRQVAIPDMPTDGEIEGSWATVESGGTIYIGMYIVPDLYRFDPATGVMEHLTSFGGRGGFVWSLAAAPDGKIYAGTYPDGKVWEYDPASGAVRGFATVAGENNVRSVAVDSSYVYAGLLDSKPLISVNRLTGAVRTLAEGDGGFATVGLGRTRVRAGSGTKLYDVKTDGTDLRAVELGGSVDAIGRGPDYTAYVSTRPQGAVYRYRTAEAPVELGVPRAQEETRRLHLEGATLTGFTGSGGVWTMDSGAHATTSSTDLVTPHPRHRAPPVRPPRRRPRRRLGGRPLRHHRPPPRRPHPHPRLGPRRAEGAHPTRRQDLRGDVPQRRDRRAGRREPHEPAALPRPPRLGTATPLGHGVRPRHRKAPHRQCPARHRPQRRAVRRRPRTSPPAPRGPSTATAPPKPPSNSAFRARRRRPGRPPAPRTSIWESSATRAC
ncbi:hypothetical protein [Streptomyces sp. NPDC101166]|uniref:hypothetical protein n=1 Tax=Streptomyces sp. NPDC101166 TaxID=3366120 RepID=UPI0037FF1D2C